MADKKRILINATCVGKNPTGIGIFTKEIISHLIKMRPELFYLIAQYDFTPGFNNKKIISAHLSPEYGPRGHINRILWTQSCLAYEYKRLKSNILFSTLPEAPIIVKNKIVVVHDIIPVRFPEVLPRMKYYFYCVVPYILKTSRHLVFDSEYTKNDVFEYYKLKNTDYSVIPAGYNKERYHPVQEGLIKEKYGYDKYFFYVGDMRPYKNLENAVKSFAAAELKNVQFLIAGNMDIRYFPNVKKIVHELNLKDRVIFTGYVPNEDLPHFYRNSIALFFPSRYEGFGLPPLEAMATGTPVITTRMASIPEVCGDAVLYVDPDDINDMAEALKRLAFDSSLRQTYSEKSLKRAALFSWEKTAGEYLDLLLEVLNEI